MKQILTLLILLFSSNIFSVTASTNVEEKTVVDVVIEKGKSGDDDTYPRTLIPILCTYTDGVVHLTLLTDLGSITLTVTNQLTGEQWSTENTITLSTSNAAGTYLVQIVTEDGSMYWGTYTL